jgi:ATP-binding cassette, subfamily B, bacterial MsbA
MKNFYRVIAMSFRHPFTVAMSLFCSLAIAVLWGGNITAIYPVVDVVMLNKGIPEWLDEKRAALDKHIHEVEASIETTSAEQSAAAGAEKSRLTGRLTSLREELERRRVDLARYDKWYVPLAHRYLPTTAFETLIGVCVALVVGTLFKSIFRVVGSYYTSKLGSLVQFELRKEFYRKMIRLDLATFRENTPGDLMNRFIGDCGVAASGATNVFGMALREPMKMIVCLAGAAWVSWQLLLLTMISAPLAGYAISWLAKSLKRANRKAIEEMSFVYDRLEEMFNGIKVIKAFTAEAHERARFHRTSKQVYGRSMRIAMYDSFVGPVTETSGIAIIVAAVLCGGYLVLNQQTHLFGIRVSQEPLTHGWLTLFYCFLAGASDPVRRLTAVFN